MLKDANVERLEHVTVTMNVDHGRRGDLSVELISPDKVVSHLAATRRLDASTEGYKDWTFMSVVHWYVILYLSHYTYLRSSGASLELEPGQLLSKTPW